VLKAIGIGRKVANHWLFRGISLSLQPGQRLALLGPSGSGKTLLLRALAMLDTIDAGEIRWHGAIISGNQIPRFRSQVMFLPQQPALPEGTVEQILRQPFSLRVYQGRQFHRQRIVEWLRSLGRSDTFLAKQHHNLSGGEAQLTALLRSVQLDPDILLLDEPTAALDTETVEMVESLVATWLDQKSDQPYTTVWVTHDHEQIQRVSNSTLCIRDGLIHPGEM